MATEQKSDTVIKVYTAKRPAQAKADCAERAARLEARARAHGALRLLRRAKRPNAARRVGAEKLSISSAWRARQGRTQYMRRATRDSLVVCALLLSVMSLKAMPFNWARQATDVMSHAVTMSVDLDKTLGQLKFVRAVVPESAMAFLSGAQSKFSAPFEGVITHDFSKEQPWLEYSGQSQPVKSASAGTVKQIEQGSAGDWAVRIAHADGIETVYAFLSETGVKVGDSVTAAQEIGRASGQNGARIYFEMRINGNPVDPSKYLGIN